MSPGDSGNLGDLDLSTLQRYMPDVNFPTSKEEVASSAESNGAPRALVQHIRIAPVARFGSLDRVLGYLTVTESLLRRGKGGGDEQSPKDFPQTNNRMRDLPGDWTGGGPDDL